MPRTPRQHDPCAGRLDWTSTRSRRGAALRAIGITQEAERVVGVRGDHHGIELSRVPAAVRTVTSLRPADFDHGVATPDGSGPSESRMAPRTSSSHPDRSPLQRPADTDEAVVIEEVQEVVDREVQDPSDAVDQTADVMGTRK